MATIPKAYVPDFLRNAVSGSRAISLTFNDVKNTNIESTSSFIYDPYGSALKSTQQLNVDWSQLENHTFFMSAEAKVNLAFDQIVNNYPFDGTKKEIENFFENITGYESWVYDQFPKNNGQLHFSGTLVGEDTDGTLGNWVSVKDNVGGLFPEIAKNPTGESVIDSNEKSMTVEMQLFVPEGPTLSDQIIFQKLSGSVGYTLYVEPTGSTTAAQIKFIVSSGSSYLSTISEIQKGVFEHHAVTFNKELSDINYLQFFKNGSIVDESRDKVKINNFKINTSNLLIGSGSSFSDGSTTIIPGQTLSGTIDEFRLWHSARTTKQLQSYSQKAIFTDEDLKLYFKFNEPSSILVEPEESVVNSIVLDSSGNSLHTLISNFTSSLRQNATDDELSNMIYEKQYMSPILFTASPDVTSLNVDLMASASIYDKINPNLITKLIPQHYLTEGQALEGFDTLKGGSGELYDTNSLPGAAEKAGVQLLLSFLYVYARFFDEIKLFIDSFKNLKYVDYNSNETMPNNFLLDFIKEFGLTLPPMFSDATIEQYVDAENIDRDYSTSELPLRTIQNELMKRVLVNIPDILKSKGTQHSIKSFLRAVGIDPDNSLRIREYGGPTMNHIHDSRENKKEPSTMVQFITSSFVSSPYLSSSRLEPGYPEIAGNFVDSEIFNPHGISDNVNDGLLTSGSFTMESIVKYTPVNVRSMTSATQSLGQINVTGSNDSRGGLTANLVAISSSLDPRLIFYTRPGSLTTSPLAAIELPLDPSNNIFNGEKWNVSFGVQRNDDDINSRVSSSYFVRVAQQTEGIIQSFASTSSFFQEASSSLLNTNRTIDSVNNSSGSFVTIGEGREVISGSNGGGTFLYLNDTLSSPQEARTIAFSGLASNVRFWSNHITETEWKEHVRNFKSNGVLDPLTNWNYTVSNSGSYGKLRLNSLVKQFDSTADSLGVVQFLDYSENNNHLNGEGFTPDVSSTIVEIFEHSFLSPAFDEAVSNNKIRSRGFLNQSLIDETPWAATSPIYELPKSELPTDDVRFAIEFSLIDALNRDIVTMFSTYDSIENAIGNPELMYSQDYPDLDRLQNIYFNRIKHKLNFKSFFEFFKWFEMSIGTFIEQLLPRKTNFKGTNFVIESHMLERHKIEYKNNETYLSDSERDRLNDVLLIQQIAGRLNKY